MQSFTDTAALLKAIEQIPQPELDAFVTQVWKLRAQRQTPSLSMSESELLLKINQGIPDHLQQRFNQLLAKRQAFNLTEADYTELVQLTDRIEQLGAERIESLAELARLQNKSLTEMMHDLGIQSPACV